MRKLLPVVLCALVVAGCDSGNGGEDTRGGSANGSGGGPTGDGRVEAAEIRPAGHLQALQDIADENDGNRAAGTPGSEASEEYVAERLREDGWNVELDPVTFPYFEERSPPRLDDLDEGSEFRTMSYSGSGRVEAPIRRSGLGCDRRAFRAVEEGEIAVAERGECFFRDKAQNAEAAGAAAVLIVDGESDEPLSATLGAPGIEIPAMAVGATAGRALGPRAELEVDAVSERRRTVNVVAETVTGRGERVVMAGGHLDSVPAGARDQRQRKRHGRTPRDRRRSGRPRTGSADPAGVLGSGGAGPDRVAPLREPAGAGRAGADRGLREPGPTTAPATTSTTSTCRSWRR